MLSEIKDFVKIYFNDIMAVIIVALLILLSFACGFIIAKYQLKQPIRIEKKQTTYGTHTTTYSFIS